MKPRLLLVAIILLLASILPARRAIGEISAEGGTPDDRASTRVLYWNGKVNASAGWFSFDYGRPLWKKVYEDPTKFDALTKGKTWRMGSNYWTLLDTCIPLTISGRRVPVGLYFLGLHRSAGGSKWSLAFINPARVRTTQTDAFDVAKAPIEFMAPMSIAKAEGIVQKLTMTLTYPQNDIKNVTLKIAWGNLALTAPIQAMPVE